MRTKLIILIVSTILLDVVAASGTIRMKEETANQITTTKNTIKQTKKDLAEWEKAMATKAAQKGLNAQGKKDIVKANEKMKEMNKNLKRMQSMPIPPALTEKEASNMIKAKTKLNMLRDNMLKHAGDVHTAPPPPQNNLKSATLVSLEKQASALKKVQANPVISGPEMTTERNSAHSYQQQKQYAKLKAKMAQSDYGFAGDTEEPKAVPKTKTDNKTARAGLKQQQERLYRQQAQKSVAAKREQRPSLSESAAVAKTLNQAADTVKSLTKQDTRVNIMPIAITSEGQALAKKLSRVKKEFESILKSTAQDQDEDDTGYNSDSEMIRSTEAAVKRAKASLKRAVSLRRVGSKRPIAVQPAAATVVMAEEQALSPDSDKVNTWFDRAKRFAKSFVPSGDMINAGDTKTADPFDDGLLSGEIDLPHGKVDGAGVIKSLNEAQERQETFANTTRTAQSKVGLLTRTPQITEDTSSMNKKLENAKTKAKTMADDLLKGLFNEGKVEGSAGTAAVTPADVAAPETPTPPATEEPVIDKDDPVASTSQDPVASTSQDPVASTSQDPAAQATETPQDAPKDGVAAENVEIINQDAAPAED